MAVPRSLPLVGDLPAFHTDRLGFVAELHRRAGDVARFRLGPYRVWQLGHPDHIQDVLVTHADRFGKGVVLQRARVVLGNGLLTAEGEAHRRHRRILQSAFRPGRVRRYAEVMVDKAVRCCDEWHADEPLDVHAAMVRMTLATAAATLLGFDVEDSTGTVERAVSDLLAAYALAFVPFGRQLQGLPFGPSRRLRQGTDSLRHLVDRVVTGEGAIRHRDDDPGPALAIAAADGRLGPGELRDEAVTLLLAGHETTANALSFALHLLAQSPRVEARVHTEVDDVVPGAIPEPSDADRLPMCRAVLAEALRLYPPSWMMSRQALRDHPVGGDLVAAGDLVVLPQWVVHRDARWWPEPLRCDPDRWLTGDGHAARPRWAYFPFGAGRRRCLGEGFAWTEAILALAAITRRWRFRPVPSRPLRLDPLITLRPHGGLWLVPERRHFAGR